MGSISRRVPFTAAIVVVLSVISACSGGGGGGCPAGTENCACLGDGTCNEGLACTDNFCVPVVCPEGSLDCPCYENGTCDSREGVQMVCEENVCVLPGEEPGGLGDPCDEDSPCGVHDGTQLECPDGTCQLPVACPAGTFGCSCDAGVCDAGLECVEETCQAAAGSGIAVGDGSVRACDVLFELANADVQFGPGVIGVAHRDGDRVAFSFTAKADAALTGPIGAVVGVGDAEPVVEGLTPSKVECFDRLGKAVAEPGVEFK